MYGPVCGGGEQDAASLPDGRRADTSTLTEVEMMNNRPTPNRVEVASLSARPGTRLDLGHGDVVIAAITSCTNTSNPSLMLAAGLAREEGGGTRTARLRRGEDLARARIARGEPLPRGNRATTVSRRA